MQMCNRGVNVAYCVSPYNFKGNCTPCELHSPLLQVCDRGVNPRVEKSANVKAAGGVGMLLLNSDPATDSVMTEFHSVPTLHLKLEHRDAVRAYAVKLGQYSL
jgi:hypothetical protein